MPVTPDKVFIYGRFKHPGEVPLLPFPFAPTAPIGSPIISAFNTAPDVAVEILREFSATELVGKVYVLGRGSAWSPVSQPGHTRIQLVPRLSAPRTHTRHRRFESMEGPVFSARER